MKRSLLSICIVIAILIATPFAQDERRWASRLAEGFQALTEGRQDAANAIFTEVVSLARDAHDDRSLAEARRGQGRVLAAKGDAAGAAAAYADALQLFESAGDAKGIGQVRSDRGFAAWQKGDNEGVRREYTAAADVFERAGLKTDHANALRNMTFSNLPRPERLALLRRALEIATESPDRRLQGLIEHALGDTLSADGDQQGAIEHYEAALPLLENANDPAILARLLTSFGRIHRIHGDAAAAIPYYERTLALVRPTADRDAERQAEDALAIANAWLRRYAEAVRHAERALELARQSRPVLVPMQTLRLGEMLLSSGDTGRALPLFEVAQPTKPNDARRVTARAVALTLTGDVDGALADANAAVTMTASMDWEDRLRAYDARSKAHQRAGHLSDAIADALASVRILEATRGGLVISDDFRVAFADGYREFFDRAVDLLARDGRDDQAFRVAESGRARALLDLLGTRPAPPSATATHTGTAVAYWVTRHATHAWVVKDDRVILARRFAVEREALESLIAKSQSQSRAVDRKVVRRGQTSAIFESDPKPALKQLHDLIFAPMRAAAAPASRLLIVADGPLLGLSFAELIDRRGRYVVEDYTLQYAPSSNWETNASRAPQNTSALLVSISSGYPKTIGAALAPLPGAQREVDALTTLFPSKTTIRVSDGAATEASVRRAMVNRGVIHFATHAITSSVDPSESFLALRPGGGDDGRLTAKEILSMSINADLVVLSACHGASGQVSGEGMLGLSRALLGAGAKTLLASVRELPDDTAATMLPRFYRSWRVSGDAAAALRSAQLEQLRRLRAGQVHVSSPFGDITMPEHPSLWAGLILIGGR